MFSVKAMSATLLLVIVSVSIVCGQTATGEVNGTVTDPNGAAVPRAAVKLTNQATKIETEATASQSGYFTFVNVKPGNYIDPAGKYFVSARLSLAGRPETL